MEGDVTPPVASLMNLNEKETKTQPAKRLPQYFAAISACMAAMSAGTVLAWSSPSLKYLSLSEGEKAGISSIMAIGALVGSFPAGYLAQKIGRRKSLLVIFVPYAISWTIIIIFDIAWLLFVARFVAGLAVGGSCVLAPMYVAEIAEDTIRGALGSYFQLFITIGILYTYLLATFCSYVYLACLSLAVTGIFGILVFFQPESPTYLMQIGDKSGAKQALSRLRGIDYNIDHELNELNKQADPNENSKMSFKEIFGQVAFRKGLIISIGLMVIQQLSGVNAVIFYAGEIFDAAGSTMSGDLCSVIIGVIQVAATFAVGLIVDKYGRKILLIFSSSMMTVSLAVLGLFFYLKVNSDVSNLGWLPLCSLGMFIIVFSLGFGPIPWMLVAEIFPPETKGVASGLAVASNWTFTFLVTMLFPPLSQQLGKANIFWLFGIFTTLGAIFCKIFVIETKGKNVSEIQNLLTGTNNPT